MTLTDGVFMLAGPDTMHHVDVFVDAIKIKGRWSV